VSEEMAKSVYEEAAKVYWSILQSGDLNTKCSAHQLKTIFNGAVIPAIKEVRRLDREYGLQNELQKEEMRVK